MDPTLFFVLCLLRNQTNDFEDAMHLQILLRFTSELLQIVSSKLLDEINKLLNSLVEKTITILIKSNKLEELHQTVVNRTLS